MDRPEVVHQRKAANARWKEALSLRSEAEQSRLDRCAVLAVAAGEKLGLSEEDLVRLRFALLGEDAEPNLQALAAEAADYDRRAFPAEGPRPGPSEVLKAAGVGALEDRRRYLEALAAVHPLIQPLESS